MLRIQRALAQISMRRRPSNEDSSRDKVNVQYAVHALLLSALFCVGGCQALSDLETEKIPKYSKGECIYNGIELGGPKSTQGDDLCHALIGVQIRQNEIQTQLGQLTNQGFNLSQLGLGVLSVGAVAANTHVSVLEGLGIASAGTLGLRTYAGVPGRRGTYSRGVRTLQCLDTNSRHLLWNDSSYYELRSASRALTATMAQIDAALAGGAIGTDLTKKAQTMQGGSSKAFELAQEAIVGYAALGGIIKSRRAQIVSKMRSASDAARGNVDQIVVGILNAERVKAAKINGTDTKAAAVADAAAKSTVPSKAATNVALTIASEVMADAAKSIKAHQGDGVSPPEDAIQQEATRRISSAATRADTKTIDPTKQLEAALASSAYLARTISNIAPQYITTRARVEACVFD